MVNEKYYGYGTAPSIIRELFAYGLQKAKEVGKDKVFDYSLGNPSIPAPPEVNETIKKLVDEESSILLHGYSMAPGFESSREAIAKNLRDRFDTNAKASELYLTCGCAPALISVAKALTVKPEDNFICIAPYFPEYNVFFTAGGGQVKVVAPDIPDFQINLDALEEAIDENTVAVVINSPNNPSGVVYTEETLVKIGDLLKKKAAEYGHPIYIIADEPYRELVYGGVKVKFIPEVYDNTIVCYSWSKSLSLPGERIGYVYIPEKCENGKEIYAAMAGASRELGAVCPPTLIQRVVEECVVCDPDLEAYDQNRNDLYNGLIDIGYECAKPDGAFYLFIKAPNGDDMAFSEAAKLEENILIVPGTGFGCPGYLRLAYCVSNEMIKNSLPGFKRLFEKYGK
ncbi:MAG TPA: pyridoxal phosphate-dependent aminotransferase [Mogibacterium sp.]|nr:pyridoxal phosphate-dependent aminotransferase [Mogibacterium sp.]